MATKGDLVLISDGAKTSTCIILTQPFKVTGSKSDDFYYSYCLESGLFGLVYEREIISIVAPDFAPDFEFKSDLFDTNYDYYADLYERFAYFPYFYPFLNDPDSEDEE